MGIDVQKTISTAVIIDDNEKVIEQIVDFETSDEGFGHILTNHPPDGVKVLFENLTAAHRVYHFLEKKGYDITVLHTGNGCVTEISKSKFKTDLADATKLAFICKDIHTGRREYRLSHITDENTMKAKALCRILNDCSDQRDKLNMKIQEYMNMFGLKLPDHLRVSHHPRP